MTSYVAVLCIHVVVAILGLGQIAGMLVLAHQADRSVGPTTWKTIERLVRGTNGSLLVMLATGALLEYLGGGPFHESWWFRLSFGAVLVLGAINGMTGRALRKRTATPNVPLLPRVRRAAWVMGALVALVTIMMESKQPW